MVRPVEPPIIISLGCSSNDVEVNQTVTCRPNLGGDDATEYSWSSIHGSPYNSTQRNYTTSWDTPGRKLISFGACNEGGCDVGDQYVTVRAQEPPRIVGMNCAPLEVRVDETVSCRPNIGGGDPTEYSWSSIDGSPYNSTQRNYTTSWDTPGQKLIGFGVCNDGGCDSQEQYVTVVSVPPVIDSLGCAPLDASVGEELSCRPDLSGGEPEQLHMGSHRRRPVVWTRYVLLDSLGFPGPKESCARSLQLRRMCDQRAVHTGPRSDATSIGRHPRLLPRGGTGRRNRALPTADQRRRTGQLHMGSHRRRPVVWTRYVLLDSLGFPGPKESCARSLQLRRMCDQRAVHTGPRRGPTSDS